MIEFEFEFQYAKAKLPILRQVGGGIPLGRCVVLCGDSGCGKSTLLRCINGLIPQFYEGELKGFCRLNGQDTAGMSIGEIGELTASVFQDPRSQFFTVNSSNEVAFGLENRGLPQDEIRRRVDEAFRIFHLERLKDCNVYALSSGERQLISILSAWAMDTDIFLLDEPTANLDFAATQQLKEILLALKRQGKTLLLSEHRLYYLADIANEFWVMADGEIKGKYTAAEAKAFSAERRQTLSLLTLDLAEITVPEKEPLPKTAPTALAVSDVRYTYGRKAGDIMALPDGFDTVIGEGGATLSGGERQRISIARAIMKDAPVIILDEATANVDPENEKELMEAVAELTHDKTVIMIAHRLKTVRHADQIFVVDHGEIVQQDTHDELVAVDGLYRRFVVERQQAAGWKV